MKRYLGLCTAAFFLSVLPGAGFAQTNSGVPPMLETQRPLAMPANQQPEPRSPQLDVAKPVCPAAPVVKSKKSTRKTCRGGGGQTERRQKSHQDCQEKVPCRQTQKQGGRQRFLSGPLKRNRRILRCSPLRPKDGLTAAGNLRKSSYPV